MAVSVVVMYHNCINLYGHKNIFKKPLARNKKLLYNNTMNKLNLNSFKSQQEYRPIGSANSADMPWLADRGFV